MASEEKEEAPQHFKLEELEQLKLQNLMLKLSVEQERVEKHKAMIAEAQASAELVKFHMETWKNNYDKTLSEHGLSIKNVEIDAESGMVIPVGNTG